MTAVPYVDSAGVGELVGCAKRAYERGGAIKIVLPPRGAVRETFRITSLDKVFEIFEHEDEALASFAV
jgi:anti-anti-sigma factor